MDALPVAVLVGSEWVAALLGWSLGLSLRGVGWPEAALWAVLAATTSVTAMAAHGRVRPVLKELAVESLDGLLSAIGWTCVALLVAATVSEQIGGIGIALGASLALLFGAAARVFQRAWLHQQWRQGRYVRRALLVGESARTLELVAVSAEHPESGWRIVGELGGADAATVHRRLGRSLSEKSVDAVIIETADYSSEEVSRMMALATDAGRQVHVLAHVGGIAHQRLTPDSIAGEALINVQSNSSSRAAESAKRAMDLVLATVLLVLSSPVILFAAMAVKIEDRGPALFVQDRIGRDGVPFRMLKLRSMTLDAEARLPGLMHDNDRTGGALFKLAEDPRVTRVGRLLRQLSIDELPQLWNVLRGEMSLVGPRPAMPREHGAFDEDLRRRTRVRPGITGLWQAQARDNPAFGPYRRLDLYYVANWTLGLDLSILAWTIALVGLRAASALTGGGRHGTTIVLD